jgi:hypothetical protein
VIGTTPKKIMEVNMYTILKRSVSSWISFVAIMLLGAGSANAQLVTNGGFESSNMGIVDTTGWINGTRAVKGWVIQGATDVTLAPVFEIVSDTVEEGNRALKVTVNSVGTNQWDIQVVADSIPVKQGVTYYYSIWARCRKPGAQVNFTMGNYAFNEYKAIRPANLTTQWQNYTMQFTVNDNQTFIRGPIHFSYAANTGNVIYIDNLQIFAVKNVTFQVHMGIQSALGTFNPATDTLVMRGNFEHFVGQTDWSGTFFKLTKTATNDSIYNITIPFPDSVAGQGIQYKYVIVGAGAPGTKDNWEQDQPTSSKNREYTVTSDVNQQLALVYFNNKSTLGVTHFITFQADMTDFIKAGFNPSTDSIEVRGDTTPLDWGPGKRMTKSLLDPNLYQYKGAFTANVGAVINFKFHADPEAKFDNTGWETGDNKTYTFADKDTVLASRKPAITVKSVISKDVTVTFRVNMTGAREAYHHTLITNLKGVFISGSAAPLAWPSNWNALDTASGGPMTKMYDDGQAAHGDSVAGDNIWSVQLTFLASNNTARHMEYKYGAVFPGADTLNASSAPYDNEAGYAVNHSLDLNDVTGTQVAVNNFGDQVVSVRELPSSGIPSSYSLSQNYPNPFNPSTNIQYSIPKTGFVTLKIYNLLGQEVATLVEGNQTAGTYVATFDASSVSSGVYFYRLASGGFAEVKKMLLLK